VSAATAAESSVKRLASDRNGILGPTEVGSPALTMSPILRALSFRALAGAVALSGLTSCSKPPAESPAPATQPAALTQDKKDNPSEVPATPAAAAPPAAAAAAPTGGPSSDFIGYPKAGWSKLKLQDTLPLCVFSDVLEREKAKFLNQVTKQNLKADHSVVFGAYGPYCINPACDDLPSLQCAVDREGQTLTVQARYIGYHKDGATCTEGCAEVTAGCSTPNLEPGKYTVKYGEHTFALQIPSVMRKPCFDLKP
jgi:hypothetical protein